ncbi:MAG TPA: hypothetical protein VNU96_16960 [Burkholderiales bacterium]|jgi:hypothetical protein|nr:hypothetical protein [Burkholderiales bacterium]
MRIVSRLLEGIVALVFVFGLLESLLTGGRTGARGLGRRISSGQSSEAWIGGYAGAMGWDGQVLPAKSETGSPASRGRRPARLTPARRQTVRARRVLASAAGRRRGR